MSKESKNGSVGGRVFAAFLSVCLVGNIGLGAYQLQKNQVSDSKVSKYIAKELKRQAEEKKKENE